MYAYLVVVQDKALIELLCLEGRLVARAPHLLLRMHVRQMITWMCVVERRKRQIRVAGHLGTNEDNVPNAHKQSSRCIAIDPRTMVTTCWSNG